MKVKIEIEYDLCSLDVNNFQGPKPKLEMFENLNFVYSGILYGKFVQ